MRNPSVLFRKSVFIVILAFCGFGVFGQQQAMFTQYMFNGLALNPAYAGSHESVSATALSRFQWIGIDGAPVTHTFSIHSPVPDKNIGLGLIFSNDQIGVTNQNTLYGSYAYMIEMDRVTIAMGLQAGFKDTNINYNESGVNDPNFSGSLSGFSPNFGVGLFVYGDRFYLGASVPTALKNRVNSTTDQGNQYYSSYELVHFFATAGIVFDINPLLKLKPSILIKAVSGAPMELDINANLILYDRVWVGLSYRSFDALSFLFNLQVTDQLRFGYSYDYTTTDLQTVNAGSHEVMLNYRLVFNKEK